MFNRILLVDNHTNLGQLLSHSLNSEGYEVRTVAAPQAAGRKMEDFQPDLVLLNAVQQDEAWCSQAEDVTWAVPVIALVAEPEDDAAPYIEDGDLDWRYLYIPFAFQDLLLLVQDTLYQRTLVGRRPSQLSAALLEKIGAVLSALRSDLNARGVVLSSSSGRLISTTGVVDQGTAISLAALMSASFTATAKAAQLLGQSDMFDSSLQESEGYGLYAIRLHNKLILSVAFSARITVGMVRHYAAQAAVDILELLVREEQRGPEKSAQEDGPRLDNDFRHTVNEALGDILEN
jgi:CheY-like chemotaxis protein